MSKFRIGDKVLYKKETFVIKDIDLDENGNLLFYKMSDSLHDFIAIEEDLELYKTAHQRLLDDGWIEVYRDEKTVRYKRVYSFGISTLDISLYFKTFKIQDDYATLEIAELIVDYLKELQDE